MKLTKRNVLSGVGLLAVSGATAFGSGAFTQVDADRSFDISVANDDASSQLVIKQNSDLESDANETTDNGIFEINTSSVPPDANVTYGNFSNLSSSNDPATLEQGFFVIQNDNETGSAVDISVGVEFDSSPSSTIYLYLVGPSDNTYSTTSGGSDATVSDVGSSEEVECGFIVETDASDSGSDIDATFSVSAELNKV